MIANDLTIEPLNITDKTRREFSKMIVGVAAGIIIPKEVIAKEDTRTRDINDESFWNLPRSVWIRRGDESLNLIYFENNQIVWENYTKICYLLRDLHQNEAVKMDIRLLDLIRAMQGYLAYYGFNHPFFINSGYRSKKTNSNLENAAKNSMHLYGKAIDFSIPGVPGSYLGKLAKYYQGGGVGFYASDTFSHIDTGSVRTWYHKKIN